MLLTVFTPAYNRASTIRGTFESLCAQNIYDFEWIVIDDGSDDETDSIINDLAKKACFEIRYVKVAHGGKHRAYNKALQMAKGELFFNVDSDDRLTRDCIGTIVTSLKEMRARTDVCGIIALKENCSAKIYGSPMPHIPETHSLREFFNCCRDGERSFVFKTEIARQYPFPEVAGEDFVTESVVYNRIGKDWNFITINKSLTICEYLPDGLSSNVYRLMLENPIGFMIYHSQCINDSDTLCKAIRHTLRYVAFRSISQKYEEYDNYQGHYKWIVNLMRPIGKVGELYYKIKCRRNY